MDLEYLDTMDSLKKSHEDEVNKLTTKLEDMQAEWTVLKENAGTNEQIEMVSKHSDKTCIFQTNTISNSP